MIRGSVRYLLLTFVVLSAACNSVLGISDHDVDPGTDGGTAGVSPIGPGGAGGGHSPGGSSGNATAHGGAATAGAGGRTEAGGTTAADAGAATETGGAGDAAGTGGGMTGTAGAGAVSGSGGSTGISGSAGVGGSGGGCAPACTGGTTCQAGHCACPTAKPDSCNSTCTDKQTDKLSCGSCGHSCLAGSCAGGLCEPITLASGRTAPWALAVNASGVYWLESSAVLAVPLAGGTVVPLASATYVWGPSAIAVSATTVYFVNSGTGSNLTNFNYAVMRVPVAGGGSPDEFGKASSNISAPWGVAVNGSTVYWLDTQWESICKAAEGAGSETPARAYDGSSGGYNYYGNVAVDDTNAYWGVTNGGIFQAPLAGGTRVIVKQPGLSTDPRVNQIVAQQGFIFWSTGTATVPAATTPGNSSISKVPIGGGTITPVASGLAVSPALAADASGVYWDDGSLKRTPLAGGAAVVLALGQNAGFIALDAQYVYWTNATTGTVMKVAK